MGDTRPCLQSPGCAGGAPWPAEWKNKLPEGLPPASHFANEALIARAGHGHIDLPLFLTLGSAGAFSEREGCLLSSLTGCESRWPALPPAELPHSPSALSTLPGNGTFRGRQREARGQPGGDGASIPGSPTPADLASSCWCPFADRRPLPTLRPVLRDPGEGRECGLGPSQQAALWCCCLLIPCLSTHKFSDPAQFCSPPGLGGLICKRGSCYCLRGQGGCGPVHGQW